MIPSNLELLVTDGVVDEVMQQIKSGKEADVFLVRRGEGLLAAKVYKERERRNFKNNAGYKEGRQARNSRDARAVERGSRFGREISEGAWKSAEADALFKLHAAGVRVPTPDVFYEGVLVMALVADAEGRPAPRLADTRLTREQALEMHKEMLRQIVLLLTCDLIHGDLSAFNILLAPDGPMIIDLPQVVSAAHNTRAEAFLRRDVANVTRYLGQYAPELLKRPDGGADIWSRYGRGELFAGYVPDTATLRDDTPFTGFRRERNHRRRRGGGGPSHPGAQAGSPGAHPPPGHPSPGGTAGHAVGGHPAGGHAAGGHAGAPSTGHPTGSHPAAHAAGGHGGVASSGHAPHPHPAPAPGAVAPRREYRPGPPGGRPPKGPRPERPPHSGPPNAGRPPAEGQRRFDRGAPPAGRPPQAGGRPPRVAGPGAPRPAPPASGAPPPSAAPRPDGNPHRRRRRHRFR